MSHLDDLKDAMATPPDFAAQPVDLATIMKAGGRVRRRRRLAVSAASGLAVAALLVGGAQLTGLAAGPGPGTGFPAAGGGSPTTQPAPSAPASAATPASTPASADNPPPFGQVVTTGTGKWVLYAVAIDDNKLPKVTFGLMAGLRAADGTITAVVETNEIAGSDRSAGFHAIEGSMNADGRDTPAFGYYVGPAVKITGVVGGKPRTAGMGTWSEDSSVHFFWFAPKASVSKLAAYDKNGHRLPAGNNSVAMG
jgi:hypothetical protein